MHDTFGVQNRIEGGLLGLLIGDAVGVPYEFNDPQNLPPIDQLELIPPRGFKRTYPTVAIGTWSDDGAQALCLLASLLERDTLDVEDLGKRFLNWYEHGYMAIGNIVFDVGNQTARSLAVLRSGTPAIKAGSSDERAQGNGSLMRVLPLVLWHQGSDRELVQYAQDQSKITHSHLTVQICCALYCLWARRILQNISDAWCVAVDDLRSIYQNDSAALAALAAILIDRTPEGTGYVVDCLHSARFALDAGSYEQVIKTAIALGNDTDTTACVAGGLAGLRDGVGAIPERWRSGLRGQDLIEPLRQKLLDRW